MDPSASHASSFTADTSQTGVVVITSTSDVDYPDNSGYMVVGTLTARTASSFPSLTRSTDTVEVSAFTTHNSESYKVVFPQTCVNSGIVIPNRFSLDLEGTMIESDPHLHLAHGGRADFRGRHGSATSPADSCGATYPHLTCLTDLSTVQALYTTSSQPPILLSTSALRRLRLRSKAVTSR